MATKRNLIAVLLSALTLPACDWPAASPGEAVVAQPKTEAETSPAVAGADGAKAGPDPFAFKVEIVLSDAARKKLGDSGESVIASASFFADPADGVGGKAVNEVGLVDLGRQEIEIPGPGSASFDGRAVRKERLALIDGEPQVNVNVYSGRRTSPDNLLSCGFFQDAIGVATSAPVRIACRLIVEEGGGPTE